MHDRREAGQPVQWMHELHYCRRLFFFPSPLAGRMHGLLASSSSSSYSPKILNHSSPFSSPFGVASKLRVFWLSAWPLAPSHRRLPKYSLPFSSDQLLSPFSVESM